MSFLWLTGPRIKTRAAEDWLDHGISHMIIKLYERVNLEAYVLKAAGRNRVHLFEPIPYDLQGNLFTELVRRRCILIKLLLNFISLSLHFVYNS